MEITSEAAAALRPGEALVFDWHRVAICCAVAGEVSLRRTSTREVERSNAFRRLPDAGAAPVFAHRRAYAELAGRRLRVDCKKRFGRRWFTSNLPPDFGLRSALGRLDDEQLQEERT